MENSLVFPDWLLKQLRQARYVVVLTGAGISAESGVPTFRDAQTGLWERFRPEELASPEAFRRDPRLVWTWYAWRRELVSRAEPNPGSSRPGRARKALSHLDVDHPERRWAAPARRQRGAFSAHRAAREYPADRNAPKMEPDCRTWEETGELPPRCPRCGGLLRPDVVWFGELLPAEALEAALRGRLCLRPVPLGWHLRAGRAGRLAAIPCPGRRRHGGRDQPKPHAAFRAGQLCLERSRRASAAGAGQGAVR